MRRRTSLAFLGASLAALMLLSANGALAITSSDDPGNNPPDWTNGTKPSCDTLDPVKTINRNFIAYKCVPEMDLQSYTFEKVLSWPAPSADNNKYKGRACSQTLAVCQGGSSTTSTNGPALHAQFVVGGNIPVSGLANTNTLTSLSYWMFFQNHHQQDARQITGSTAPDCQRYAHAGPYLSGNIEYMFLFWNDEVAADTSGGLNTITFGMGDYDPWGRILYEVLPTPAFAGPVLTCGGTGGHVPSVNLAGSDPGTQASWTVSGGTLDLYVPGDFHRNIAVQSPASLKVTRDYYLAKGGDTISGVVPESFEGVNIYSTPEIDKVPGLPDVAGQGPGCSPPSDPCSAIVPATGLGVIFTADWIPWAADDQGIFTPQTSAVNGPSCPYFTVPLAATATTYAGGAKGTNGEDLETQLNPLFAKPGETVGNGRLHYDSSEVGAATAGPLHQDHIGPTQCDVLVPTAEFLIPAAGGSFTF